MRRFLIALACLVSVTGFSDAPIGAPGIQPGVQLGAPGLQLPDAAAAAAGSYLRTTSGGFVLQTDGVGKFLVN